MSRYAKWISQDEILPFTSRCLTYGGTVYVNPPPQMLKKAGYLPLTDGVLRPGKNLRTVYSTDGQRIYRNTIEVTQ